MTVAVHTFIRLLYPYSKMASCCLLAPFVLSIAYFYLIIAIDVVIVAITVVDFLLLFFLQLKNWVLAPAGYYFKYGSTGGS